MNDFLVWLHGVYVGVMSCFFVWWWKKIIRSKE
jgi:hypothetical protein